jgi:glycosyltransferase involved in cell wall biosynthesis
MNTAPWGGSEELWGQAALRLAGRGHRVFASVASWTPLSPRVRELSERGVEVHPRKLPRGELLRRIYRRALRRPEKFALGQWLREIAPDLVVVCQGNFNFGTECLDYCRQAGLPYAAVLQGNNDSFWFPDAESRVMGEAYGAARRIFFVSQHNWRLLEWQVGRPLPNGCVVFNPNKAAALGEAPPWPDHSTAWKMACVARLEPADKGQDVLFKTLALPAWRTRELELHLYGTGPNEAVLRSMAQRLQLERVHFHGHEPDVRAIWAQNHLLVLPSRCEGMPLTLLEAMWCARPAVVTDVGGNAELCADGETGFVASAPAVGPLDQALERAWSAREQWQALGQAARRRIQKISPADTVEDFCAQIVESASLR